MKQNFKRKLLAGLLSACMIFQTVGTVPIYAAENVTDSSLSIGTSSVCTHHVHDENCGYTEGTPCNHEHKVNGTAGDREDPLGDTDECYPVLDGGEVSAEPTACKHEHNAECGYKEGTPCSFDTATCESCKAKNTVDADNIVTFAGEEVYAVYDTGKFYAATKTAPSTATTTVISDKNTINHLYVMGASIPEQLMFQSTTLKTVTCADTVTKIGLQAFSGCEGLTSAQLPKVTTIGGQAFRICKSLASVEMSSVTKIDGFAFQACAKLASVAMPNVISIGNYAFSGCTSLTSAQLPKVTTIGNNAFSDCINLASVEMPSATSIGNMAFSNCQKLASLTLGATPPTVGADAFKNCPTSRTLTIQCNPDSLAVAVAAYKAVNDGNIEDELWYGWTLPSITPSAGTLEITAGNSNPTYGTDNTITLTATFDKATNIGKQKALIINKVEFKDGTAVLGNVNATQNDKGKWVAALNVDTKGWAVGAHNLTATFSGNEELVGSTTKEVTVTVNESYAVYDGNKFCRATKENPSTATSEEITDKKTINHLYIMGESVPRDLMNSCTVLTSVKAPSTTTIGTYAFSDCTQLASLTLGATPPTVGADAFKNCPTSRTLTIQCNPDSQAAAVAAYKAVNDGSIEDNLWHGWTLPNTINEVYAVYDGDSKKFYAATQTDQTTPTTTEITDKKTITNLYINGASVPNALMGDAGISPNTTLKTVTCANTVTSIGDRAFYKCSTLTSVEMPNVNTIGTYAFNECKSLKSVELPNAISIGINAFYYCESLTSAKLPKVTGISVSAFDGCAKLASVAMLGATSIGKNAFLNCTSLISVAMPNAASISDLAFRNCTSLTSVEMSSATTIGFQTFLSCTALKSIAMPIVTEIGVDAFFGCTSLASVEMPKVTTIGDKAFHGTAITSTSLPSVTTIGINAFEGCTGLTSVEMPKVTSIGSYAFNGCTGLASLTLGATPPTVGADAFKNCPTSRTLTIQCTLDSQADAVAKYKAVNDGSIEDNLWYGWTLPKTINEVYAVYDGDSKKFYAATAESPKVPTTTVISDKKTINHLYIMGASVPKGLMGDWQNPCLNLKTVICADTVTTIGTNAFQKCKSLASVAMPNVDTIGTSAFYYCESLASVAIPKVKAIRVSVFVNCKALASVDVSGVTAIGDEAFSDCTSLTSLAMPNATTIGKNAFSGCANLTSVEMPKVTSIDPNAFYNCTSLASLTLGVTPPTVGADAFLSCHNSRTLTIQGNTAFKDTVIADYNAVADGDTADNLWYGWTLPTLLDGTGVSTSEGKLTTTGNAAPIFGTDNAITLTATFDKAAKIGKQRALAINDVEFKNGVTLLGTATAIKNLDGKWVATLNANTKDWALGVHNLTATFAGNHELLGASTTNEVTVTVNESYAVYDGSIGKFYAATAGTPTVPTTTEITDKKTINNLYIKGESVPQSLMYDWKSTENTTLKTVTCANTVTTIGNDAFYDCKSLTSANLPKATSIGEQAFSGCTSLASVELSSATTIGNDAFFGCTSLVSVKMSSATTIGDRAFNGCTKLTSTQLHKVTTIGIEAFSGCASLENVTMPKVTDIGEGAFYNCASLASVEMPEATNIGVGAFSGCTSLASAKLPSATTIDASAFFGCTSLASVQLPKVTTIGEYAFYNCAKLASVAMPKVTSIGGGVFNNCKELASVEMPNVTTIGEYAFYNCAKLTSVEIPNVTSIGNFAFKLCTTLASLTLGATPPTVGGNTFNSCLKTNALTIQGNTAFKDTVLADYNTAAGNDGTADEKWYGWTLPTSLNGTGVSTSEGKLTAAGSVTVDYGTDNTITFTASFAKLGENKLRTLAENKISLLNGKDIVKSETATLTDGVYSATFTVNTKDFTVGDYNYTATFDGNRSLVGGTATETVTVTINKIDQEALSIGDVPNKVTYGDSNLTLSTTGGSGSGAVTYAVTAGSDVVSVTSAGEVTVKKAGTATITATKAGETNYNAKTDTVEITVQAATPTLTWGTTEQFTTYTGSPVLASVLTAPTVTLKNGESYDSNKIQYAYKKAGLFSLFTGYTDGLPTVSGEYTIKAKIAAEGNYTQAESTNTMTLTVNKSTPSITISTMNGKTYDGTAMANPAAENMTITGAAYTNVIFAYSKNSNMVGSTTNAPKDAGNYYVQASVVAGDNTNAASSAAVSFTIAKASALGVSQEYPVVKTLAKDYSFDLSKLLPSISSTQEYGNVTYAVASTSNANSVLTAVPTNSDIKNGKLTLKVANVADKDKTATVSISITTDNFTVANAVITVKTVDKIPLTISNVAMAERVYSGSAYAYTGTPTFTNTTDNQAVTGVTFTTEYEGRAGTTYTKSVTAPTNAGEYNLILTVSGASAETYAGTLTVPFAITKKEVTVKAKDKGIFAGAEIPSLSNPILNTDYTTDGFIGNDTLTGTVSMGYTGTPDNTKRGSYPIAISGTASDNYTVKYESGTLTISIDVSLITAAITAANNAKGGIAIYDIAASSVPNGTKFVTTAEMNTLNTAIQTATDAKASCTTLAQVQAAVKTLDDAAADFKAAIKTGTYIASTPAPTTAPTPAPTTAPTPAPTTAPTPAPTTAPTTSPTPKATDGAGNTQKPTAGKTTAAAEVDAQGKAAVKVPEKSINDAITNAQQTAKKNGTEENGIAVEIEVTSDENINSVSTTLSEESIKELVDAGVKEVTFKSEMGDITLDLETLEQIQKEQGDITISVSKTDISNFDEKLKKEIGDRPVYELNLTKADGTRVTNFDGSITIAIPYTLQEGEDPSNIAVVYINERGEKEIMSGSRYDEKTQSVIFTTRHFSTFAIVLTQDKNDAPITDIKQADGTTTDIGNANETADTQGGISTGIMVTIVIAAILAIAMIAGGVYVIVKKRRE